MFMTIPSSMTLRRSYDYYRNENKHLVIKYFLKIFFRRRNKVNSGMILFLLSPGYFTFLCQKDSLAITILNGKIFSVRFEAFFVW